jgi:hypothetical protein
MYVPTVRSPCSVSYTKNVLDTDPANATLNGDSIIGEFEKLHCDNQRGKALTNIQCQATATNIRDVIIYSVVSANASNSCLLATKALCDNKTLPWIRRNALGKLTEEGLIVVMNDFFDGEFVALYLLQSLVGVWG